MMGMAQRMPQRPQMGPSPMTAGRPNPMAGFQGGPPQMMQNPNPGPSNYWTPQRMQNAQPMPLGGMGGGAQGLGPMQGQIQNSLGAMQGAMGGGPNMIQPALQQMQGAMGGGPNMQGQMQNSLVGMQGAMGNMRQRRFPGALGRGIMQAMAPPPPQMAPAGPNYAQRFASGWGG
jgi:hypothetical protein